MTQIIHETPVKEQPLAHSIPFLDERMLEDKVALITGSNKGIGFATAQIFAHSGASVVINGRNAEDNDRALHEIQGFGGDAISIVADVTKQNEIERMVEKVIDRYGTIDILVNNAGTSRVQLIHKMTDNDLKSIVDINLKAAHLCTRAVLPYFRAEDRRDQFKKIVNLSSVTGVTGNFGQSNYGLSKAGLIAYSKACAREFARDRINVNVIAPGFTETQMTQVKHPGSVLGIPSALRNLAISCTPFARNNHAGQPYHIARGILFFSSPLSDWTTGQVIIIGGGMYV